MRVEVLNGVNLDVLGRRDPQMYGGLSLNELESRIYEWGKELGFWGLCRQWRVSGHGLIGVACSKAVKRRGANEGWKA